MTEPSGGKPDVIRNNRNLGEGETFHFACHSDLECFNRCCADVNIVLTPTDILQLSRRLGLTTTEFLDRHALVPITKDLRFPVVMLKMGPEPEKRCNFVAENGCTVYEDRPWACRMYPVGMGIPPAKAGVEPKPVYFLFEDDFCHGHRESKRWKINEWRDDQGLPEREAVEEGFREIVSHPWFIGGRKLDARRMEMFHMAAYDLDRFRRFVFESSFLDRFELEPDLVERIRDDDKELLGFAFRWLKYALFAEPTITARDGAPPSQDKA